MRHDLFDVKLNCIQIRSKENKKIYKFRTIKILTGLSKLLS
jgi:hypothetical protein